MPIPTLSHRVATGQQSLVNLSTLFKAGLSGDYQCESRDFVDAVATSLDHRFSGNYFKARVQSAVGEIQRRPNFQFGDAQALFDVLSNQDANYNDQNGQPLALLKVDVCLAGGRRRRFIFPVRFMNGSLHPRAFVLLTIDRPSLNRPTASTA
tara:strand:- start:2121 stop:2576 length:456 start_codon:yes stop_codon:yes gene_type:complete